MKPIYKIYCCSGKHELIKEFDDPYEAVDFLAKISGIYEPCDYESDIGSATIEEMRLQNGD